MVMQKFCSFKFFSSQGVKNFVNSKKCSKLFFSTFRTRFLKNEIPQKFKKFQHQPRKISHETGKYLWFVKKSAGKNIGGRRKRKKISKK
jgi:hypothetical protein